MMENTFLWAQIFGFFGFACSVLRMQLKNPRHIALAETPAGLMWSIQYYLLNAQAGMIINLLCVIRGVLIYYVSDKAVKYVIAIFFIIVFPLILTKSENAYDVLALLGVSIYGIACLHRDNRPVMARLIALHCIPWIIYNIITFSLFGVLSSTLGILSCFIGMARHENWEIGRCYRSFFPSLARALMIKPQTYP